jgi:hypothetical protein
MEAHLLFHLALVSSPTQQRKQPAPEAPKKLEKKLEKMLQQSVHHARPHFRLSGLQRLVGELAGAQGDGEPAHRVMALAS